MKFNRFLWNNYLLSDDAKKWASFFENHKDLYLRKDEKLKEFLTDKVKNGFGLWTKEKDVNDEIDLVCDNYEDLILNINDDVYGFPPTIESDSERDTFLNHLYNERFENEDDPEDYYQLSYHDIPSLSVALYLIYPDYFFPYYFFPNMSQLQKIFNTFGIFLPNVPARKNDDERFLYYLELCKSLRDFWLGHDLDPKQIPIFLYGFCPNILEEERVLLENLPKPKRALFIGGGGRQDGDAGRLDAITFESQTNWGGGKDSIVGDIVVMYVRTPRSEIHSIWRVIQPGSVEPFFHYYETCKIGFPIKVPVIHLNELKSDPVLSEMGLVKGNLQGLNGKVISKKYYDRILSILAKKGFEVEKLPQLEDVEFNDMSLKNEQDVEMHILEPFLKELGYREQDWQRQVSLQVGRSEKVIPDYLINVKNHSIKLISADWVWEAKFSIGTHKQLAKDFNQAVSYARLVEAKGVGLLSKEGLWVGIFNDQFSLKKAYHISANNLFKSDHISEVKELIRKALRG